MGIQGWEAQVEEGDVLYLPPFFWHYAENKADSISIESKWADIPMLFQRPFLSGVVLSATRPSVLHHFKGRRDPSVLPPADVFAR